MTTLGRAVFIDTETTGLAIETSEIIEVYAELVDLDTDTVLDTYEARILPSWSLDPNNAEQQEALQINGYNHEVWARTSVLAGTVVDRLYPMLEKATLIGMNVSFDEQFIDRLFLHYSKKQNWYHRKVDIATLAWPFVVAGLIPNTRLDTICDFLGISNEGAHTAKADVLHTKEAYYRLMEYYKLVV